MNKDKLYMPQTMFPSNGAKGNRSLIQKDPRSRSKQINSHKTSLQPQIQQQFYETVISQAEGPAVIRNSNWSHDMGWKTRTMYNLEREAVVCC